MQIIKNRLAILSQDSAVINNFLSYEPFVLQFEAENFEISEIEILLVDSSAIKYLQNFADLAAARKANRIKKVVLLTPADGSSISTTIFNQLAPDLLTEVSGLTSENLLKLFTEIQQTDQNNAYLSLANELNLEYEKIKLELEEKIHDKTKNLIESRRKVFEINSRIEFLRKALYTISEIKSIDSAEPMLNELLTGYNKVTWLKIVAASDAPHFESDLNSQLESTLFKAEINIHSKIYSLYFFKGDKRPFRKDDILLFKKLSETLQINLLRIDNLQNLKTSENFFDLAFHSSQNPILVIDQNYLVHQANHAALQKSENKSQTHCYEILFNRQSKCAGCSLGRDFQIQDGNSFFNVHSQPLSLMEHEDNQFWVHVYEDSTEQNLYEKKISQFARLEELGLISSSIAHELNNPLGGILSFLQIMKMELPAHHPFSADLNMMQETALRMKKIIEDLLIFSRSHQELSLEPVDVYSLTQAVVAQFDLQFKVEKIKVSFSAPSEPLVYQLSRTRLQDSVNLILQFFLQKSILKKNGKHSAISLVEVKITQDQMNSYLSFASNFGPFEDEFKTKDLNLLAIEKTLTDQGFQLFITEPAHDWIQLSILFPKDFTARS